MSIEQNVAVARRFYECFSANDLDGVMATLSDDARFRVPGKPSELSSGRRLGEDRNRVEQLSHAGIQPTRFTIVRVDQPHRFAIVLAAREKGFRADQELFGLVMMRVDFEGAAI